MKKYIFLILSIFSFVLSMNFVTSSNAFFFCGDDLGSGLSSKTNWINAFDMVAPSVGARTYTAEELFQNGFRYATPYGIIKQEHIIKENNIVKDKVSDLSDEQITRLEAQGKKGLNCVMYGFADGIRGMNMMIANAMTGFIKWSVTSLFNDNFICKEDSPQGSCVDLLGIIGGKNNADSTGLIKNFSKNIFFPLLPIFVIGGLVYLFSLLLKSQVRTFLSGAGFMFLAFILGLVVYMRPFQVARGPQTVNTFLSNAILDAITQKDNSSNLCESSALSGTPSELLQLKTNSLTCIISKGFVLDKWSIEQFGYPIDDLWTVDPPDGREVYSNLHGSSAPEDYCVNMEIIYSPNDLAAAVLRGENPSFTGKAKCNIALAYLSNTTQGYFGTKAKMEHIVATASMNEKMWTAFTAENRSWFNFMPILSIFIASFAFIPVVFYAHAYSFISTIMLTLLPVFILIGIIPERGKKILLGFLETIVSNILKYFISALFALIMIAIYSGVFAAMSGFGLFIASIILTWTFIMYRKELVNLVGEVSFAGGKRMSNQFEKGANALSKGVGRLTASTAGNALGSAAANAANGESILKGALEGAGRGITMELKRGRSFTASAARGFDQTSNKLSTERKQQERDIAEDMKRAQQMNEFKETMQDFASKQPTAVTEHTLTSRKNNLASDRDSEDVLERTKDLGMNGIQSDLANLKEKALNSSTNEEFTSVKMELDSSVETVNSYVSHIENNGHDIQKGTDSFVDAEATKKFNVLSSHMQAIDDFKKNATPEQIASIDKFIDEKLSLFNAATDDFAEKMSGIKNNISNTSLDDLTSTTNYYTQLTNGLIQEVNTFKSGLENTKIDIENETTLD